MALTKTCTVSGQAFNISDQDLEFYERMGVKTPTLSPIERWRRRLAWRHSGELFRDKCALTGQSLISMYAPEQGLTVYDQDVWWSDRWDPFDYGRDFDFSKPALPQIIQLSREVPKIALVNTQTENSKYTNHTLGLKNCHLIFGGAHSEDCLHGYFVQDCRDVVDSDSVVSCELCFDIIASINCYRCAHITDCQNCSDSFLLQDCIGCQDCIACIGLKQKKYHILNQPYTEADYKRIKTELQLHKRGGQALMMEKFSNLKAKTPHPDSHQYNCENCTGDHLFGSKNMIDCFDCKNGEDCKYVSFTPNGQDSIDCTFSAPIGVQHCYETISSLGQEMIGCMLVWHSDNTAYSIECHNSSNLLGCAGLKNQKNVVLNKAYNLKEYEALRAKIIAHMQETGEWGEFFTVQDSPYAYNHSLANTLFPLDKTAALESGYQWGKSPEGLTAPSTRYLIPDDIGDVSDELCDAVLTCVESAKPYQVSPAELAFYRKMSLPVPDRHPDVRKKYRLDYRNPRILHDRTCQQCKSAIRTNFAPENPTQVLCKNCYLKVAI